MLAAVTEATPKRLEGSGTIARSTALALLTQVVTATFTAGVTLFLVRRLGPDEFGVFSLALGIAGLLLLPADFGIAHSAARFIAERRASRDAAAGVLADAVRLQTLCAAGVATALGLLAGSIASAYGEPDLAWPLRFMAVSLFGQSLMALFGTSFIAVGRIPHNLRLVMGESAVEAGATVALVLIAGGAGGAAAGRAVGYVTGAILGLVLAMRLFGRRAGQVRGRGPVAARRLAGYAGALLVVNGAYSLFMQIDVLLIGAILSTSAVGLFSAPMRLMTLLHYPGLALSNSVSPRVVTADGRRDGRPLGMALRWLIVVQAAMVAPVLVWAQPISDLLLGERFAESAEVLRGLTPYVFLLGMAPLISVSVNYLGQARRRVPIALSALMINVVIDVALLEEIGVVAAAIGTSVAYTVYVGGHLRLVRELLDLPLAPLVPTLVRSLLAAAAMAAVLALFGTASLSTLEWVLGAAGGVAAFLAVLVLTREVSPAELRGLRARPG